MNRAVLVLLALPVAALAQYGPGPGPKPGELGNPTIGAPLGRNDPPHADDQMAAVPPALPAAPIPLEDLRRKLIGKPVHGPGTSRIGTVSDVVVGGDLRVTNITVEVDASLDPDRANLPVPWEWVRDQLDNSTVVIPWDPALVAWLTEPGRSRRTPAGEPPPPAERAAAEQAAAASLEEWRARIEARSGGTTPKDWRLRQLQLSYGAAEARYQRLREAEPEEWATEQAKLQAELDDLNSAWTELAETAD